MFNPGSSPAPVLAGLFHALRRVHDATKYRRATFPHRGPVQRFSVFVALGRPLMGALPRRPGGAFLCAGAALSRDSPRRSAALRKVDAPVGWLFAGSLTWSSWPRAGGSIRPSLELTGSTRDPCIKNRPANERTGVVDQKARSHRHMRARAVWIITSKAFQIVSVAATRRPRPAQFQPRPLPPSHGAAGHARRFTVCAAKDAVRWGLASNLSGPATLFAGRRGLSLLAPLWRPHRHFGA
jgi:hypothetical protein